MFPDGQVVLPRVGSVHIVMPPGELSGDPTVNVELPRVRRNTSVHVALPKPRTMSLEQAECLATHTEQLAASGIVYRNPNAVCASVAMAVQKKHSY